MVSLQLNLLRPERPQTVQPHRVAAMVVQNRQRITRAISAAILSLAVHLPQLVWRTPFETLQGRRVRIFFPYQAPPLQDPVNGVKPLVNFIEL